MDNLGGGKYVLEGEDDDLGGSEDILGGEI